MPVDIQEIENQKENIAPLREGRSAAALAETFASTPLEAKTSQHAERQQFEELLAGADELDDPLEPYLDYIRWVNDKFPQGHTAESGLIPLLERCTSQFRDTSYYKNDPRYLRVWMTYVKYSDAPKELFTYLSRKDIGQQLSTYYEEYASYLEANGRKLQADEVYKRGIDLEARPLERLKRRYREFLERLEANPPGENEPSSPAMPTVRQALAQKEARSDTFESEPTSRGRSDKIQVFTDSGDSAPAVNAGGWDTIGSLASRRKENVMEARPWAGEKLKQQVPTQISSKMSIYRDMPAIPQPPQPVPGKRPERLKVALEFLYDENGEDYCIEEVLARARRTADAFSRKPESPKSHMMTVPLKDSSPKVPGSPTMTMHTKAATAEIYDMFNQPLKDGFDDDDNQTGYSINYDVTETNFTNNNQL
ncbi:spindle assembly checkpoint component Mad3p [Trichomonascus vanleenenianus]|uniref:Mad3p n=1 Tax=Trichomonascus vanleenenianus TaxID=2268995 RepID=UPI003EC9C5E9